MMISTMKKEFDGWFIIPISNDEGCALVAEEFKPAIGDYLKCT
jgi:hypothetical protein